MVYSVIRQLIMDRNHESSAVATPMGVDLVGSCEGGGAGEPGDEDDGDGEEHWWWDEAYECYVCSVGKGPPNKLAKEPAVSLIVDGPRTGKTI